LSKKFPNRFNIEFKQENPTHTKAMKILNNFRNKTDIVALAICAYNENLHKSNKSNNSNGDIEKVLNTIMPDILEESLKKVLGSGEFNTVLAKYSTKEEMVEIETIDVDAADIEEKMAINDLNIEKINTKENYNSEIIDIHSSEIDSDIIQGLANFGIKFNTTED
jgi:methionine synthase II (cobalamin-independent)